MASRVSRFLAELKRRKVTRVAFAYLVVGVGVVEGVEIIGSPLGLPGWVLSSLSLLVVVGFPVSLVLSWALELTAEGIQRTPDLTPEQLAAHTPGRWSPGSWVLAGVSLCLMVVVGYLVFLQIRGPRLDEDLVAVFPFENRTGDPSLDHLGPQVADAISDGILWIRELQVVGSDQTREALLHRADGESTRDLAAPLGAAFAVTGYYTSRGEGLEVRGEGVDVGTGQRIGSLRSSGPVSQIDSILGDIQSRTAAVVLLGRSGLVDPTELMHVPTYEAAVACLQGHQLRRSGDPDGALPHYREAHALDTAFLLPVASQVWTLNERTGLAGPDRWAEIDSLVSFLVLRRDRLDASTAASMDRMRARLAGDLEGVLRGAHIQEYTEGRTTGHGVPLAALAVGNPQEALDWLEDFDPFTLLSTWYAWEAGALANLWLGRYSEALAEAREGRSHFPDNYLLRQRELQALVALGRVEEIEPLLNELEALEPDPYASPGLLYYRVATDLLRFGHPEEAQRVVERALAWYRLRDPNQYRLAIAQTLLLDERFTDALSTLSPLSDENPDSLPVRGVLGIAYAQADDAEGALAEATWFDNLNTPYLFGEDLYWRAAILAHLGDREEATRTLRRAHDEGFRWSNPSKPLGDIISDPNFRPLWGYEPFRQLIAPKR